MRKYPAYTLADLEKFVAEGRGNPAMVEEIAARKSGASPVRVVPQIEPMGRRRSEADTNRALASTAGRSTQSDERAEILRRLGV